MTTYIKTLCADGRSPQVSLLWPLPTQQPDGTWEPGEWVTSRHVARRKTPLTPGDVNACRPAVYACRPDQLVNWIAARAWYIELDRPVEGRDKVGARAGRLLRPVEGWTDDALRQFAFEAADRAVRIAVVTLRAVGLADHADQLAACQPITDEQTASVAARAADAAYAAVRAARHAADAAVRAARHAADAAYAATSAASAAAHAAYYADAAAHAAYYADAAADAAHAAAYADAAAYAAASTAASTAAYYADAAADAALAADAAYAAEREWQARRLAELVGLEEA